MKINTGSHLYNLYRKRMLDLNGIRRMPWSEISASQRSVWNQMAFDLPDQKDPDRKLLQRIWTICSANTTPSECKWAVNKIAVLLYEHLPKNAPRTPRRK